ncbi:DUF6527 family protein [Salinisphaera shabanensis]|uniref:DUF6527 family protein n=1 Tax=Salinisphaera shabanensis TaxID=180542 RepID=UPI0033416078
MTVGWIRKCLEFVRLIPSTEVTGKITPRHPASDQIFYGEVTIVRDQVDKWACFRCPGGCGEAIKLSLNRNRRPRWTATCDWLMRPTVSPSVRQLNECKCHFWIRRGRVDWCADSGRRS